MLSMQAYDDESVPGRQTIRMTGMSFAVVDKYKDLVFRTALTAAGNYADAEDIMQEVFFKYFRTEPDLECERHERAWFVRVTINTAHNLLRTPWYRRRADVDVSSLPEPAEGSEEESDVLRAVLSLPEKYRIAIYLHYYEGCSIEEIASLLKKSEAAVGQYLARGRQKLRTRLGGAKK